MAVWKLNDIAPLSGAQEFEPPAAAWTRSPVGPGLLLAMQGAAEPARSTGIGYANAVTNAGAFLSAANVIGASDDVVAFSDTTDDVIAVEFDETAFTGETPAGVQTFTIRVASSGTPFGSTLSSARLLQGATTVKSWSTAQMPTIPATGVLADYDLTFDASALNGTFDNLQLELRVNFFGGGDETSLDSIKFTAQFYDTGGGTISGAVSNASSATTLSTPAGTQAHAGAVSNAASATSTSAPTGTQAHTGAVSAASSASTLSTPAGTQAHAGVVAAASTSTTLSEPAGSTVSLGAVDAAASTTTLSTPTGTQEHAGVNAAATSATSLSEPAGTQAHVGTVDAAASTTSTSSPQGAQAHQGTTDGASSATFLSTVAGLTVMLGTTDNATSATALSEPAGEQTTPEPAPAPAIASGGSGDGAHRIPTQGKPRRTPVEVDDPDEELFYFAAALISSGVLECL